MGLARRLVSRMLTGVVTVWVAASGTFLLLRQMPGDPVRTEYNAQLTQGLRPGQAAAATSAVFGFNPGQSLPHQYLSYLKQLAHLHLGESLSSQNTSVLHILSYAAPLTTLLVLSAIAVSFVLGASAGLLAAVRHSTRIGDLLTVSGSVLNGIPLFVLAILLAYVLTTLWAIFPVPQMYDPTVTPGWNFPFIGSVITHAILPVATYALSGYGGWLLAMKSSAVSVLSDDFVLAAELRGLRPLTVARYVTRNAMLPVVAILSLSIGLMFSGSLFIEDVFNYPGLGAGLSNSVIRHDYPVMASTFLIITAAVVVCSVAADLVYGVLDPRLRAIR
jgi:peptide/nickel transport system permease protein